MGTTGNGQPPVGRKSVIDRGTTVKGSVASSSTVLVLGVLEGEVIGPAVEVEAGGVLVGKAKVGELRSRGELAGEFEADDVELTGRVRDQTVIRAKALLVSPPSSEDGDPAPLFGECQIEVGEPPSKEQAVSQALAAARPAPQVPSAPAPSAPLVVELTAEPPPEIVAIPVTAEGQSDPTPADRPAEGDSQSAGQGVRRKRSPSERPTEGV